MDFLANILPDFCFSFISARYFKYVIYLLNKNLKIFFLGIILLLLF